MKNFKIAAVFAVLLSTTVHAATWMDVRLSHETPVFRAGESVEAVVALKHEPSTTGYKIKVFAEVLGGAQQEVALTRGAGSWHSSPLPLGASVLRFTARLVGPAANPVDQLLETNDVAVEAFGPNF